MGHATVGSDKANPKLETILEDVEKEALNETFEPDSQEIGEARHRLSQATNQTKDVEKRPKMLIGVPSKPTPESYAARREKKLRSEETKKEEDEPSLHKEDSKTSREE